MESTKGTKNSPPYLNKANKKKVRIKKKNKLGCLHLAVTKIRQRF
jgi:hypothetical protein